MKKLCLLGFVCMFSLLLTSCSAIETIFKAGMWWAFFLVFLVIGLIIWLFSKMGKNK